MRIYRSDSIIKWQIIIRMLLTIRLPFLRLSFSGTNRNEAGSIETFCNKFEWTTRFAYERVHQQHHWIDCVWLMNRLQIRTTNSNIQYSCVCLRTNIPRSLSFDSCVCDALCVFANEWNHMTHEHRSSRRSIHTRKAQQEKCWISSSQLATPCVFSLLLYALHRRMDSSAVCVWVCGILSLWHWFIGSETPQKMNNRDHRRVTLLLTILNFSFFCHWITHRQTLCSRSSVRWTSLQQFIICRANFRVTKYRLYFAPRAQAHGIILMTSTSTIITIYSLSSPSSPSTTTSTREDYFDRLNRKHIIL